MEAKELHVKKHGPKMGNSSETFDKLETDHIIGDQFGGSNLRDNLLSQDKDLNRDAYYKMESEWRAELDANPPKKVTVQIDIEYPKDGSQRPTAYHVSYKIGNNKKVFKDFNNSK
ncbi:hypothetical protein EQG49_04345 [Periweissella cryptocerci]|uniref:Type VII secretion system protein EssD-like domain-containing protein n=1 Tax=Periweissella cryptocerci TaxID=2506420 RepID=A0A4V1AIJ7_9LACO|nr:DNA/RNA non-specific endonuclease [Periweissella cryptocerci]QBO35745.1 hypothetical protein EQG49_04345 [Periweissella cryptocerci]